MSLTQKTITGGAIRFTSLIIKGLLQLFVLSFFTRYISPKDFGTVSIITSILAFVTMFTEIGLGPALIQNQSIKPIHIRVAFTSSWLIAILIYLSIYYCTPWIAHYYNEPLMIDTIRFTSLSFIFSGLGIVSSALLRKKLNFKTIMYVELSSFFISYCIVGVILVIYQYGIWAYLIAIVAQNLINSLLFFILQPHDIRFSLNKSSFKELFHFAGFLTLEKLFNTIARQADMVISGKVLGLFSLGLYGRANQLMDIPNQYVGQAIDNVLFPAMSIKQNQTETLKLSYIRSISLVNLLMYPLAVFMIIWAPEIILLAFGKNWIQATLPLQILCAVLPFKTSIKVTDSLVRAMGAFKRSAFIKIIYAVCVIIFTLVSCKWGLVGVSIGVNLALMINYFITTTLAKNLVHFQFKEYKKIYLPGILLGGIFIVCSLPMSYCTRHIFLVHYLPSLCIALATQSMIAGFLLLYYPSWFGANWKWIYSTILEYFKPKNASIISLKQQLIYRIIHH